MTGMNSDAESGATTVDNKSRVGDEKPETPVVWKFGGQLGQPWDEGALDLLEETSRKQWTDILSNTEIDTKKMFIPNDENCVIWEDPPNKLRCASFGDRGTTASASCFGDLIQMSQYLGVGNSGVFTMDQCCMREPYWVADRAKDLDTLAGDLGGEFSFLLDIPECCCPDEDKPPKVKWVNWRWPRYEYTPIRPGGEHFNVCYQFMVHNGIVLQQFGLENTEDTETQVGRFELRANIFIRDLDFLKHEYPFNEQPEVDNQAHYYDGPGPRRYGHVYVHTLPEHGSHCSQRCSGDHAVAAVTTVFVNGSAVALEPQDDSEDTFTFAESLSVPGKGHVQVVVARKLLAIPYGQSDWRNFLISAEDADIDRWLEEEETRGRSDASITRHLKRVPAINEEHIEMMKARDSLPCDGASENTTESDRSRFTELDRAEPEAHKSTGQYPRPSGSPSSGDEWSPNDHLQYLAFRHTEHILSVCAMPLSKPGLIKVDGQYLEIPGQDTSTPVALTCDDISGHRINTSASFFAFQFLVDFRRRLHFVKEKSEYISNLEERIKDVCGRHIAWLQQIRLKQDGLKLESGKQPPWIDEDISNEHVFQSGCFAANYWVTGNIMTQQSRTWQPQNRMTDTAFQILKLSQFKELEDVKKDAHYVIATNLMKDIYVPWLTELDRLDIRKLCSWPHSNMEGIVKFRLDDHFWIWKAIKCLIAGVPKIRLPPKRDRKEIKLEAEYETWLKKLHHSLEPPTDQNGMSAEGKQKAMKKAEEDAMEEAIREFKEITQRLSPSNVQRNVLQRFTAENDVMKPARRMLAVTRSAIDMRFFLHSRDTALFNDNESEFFTPGSSFTHLWQNTIYAQLQVDHEERMDSDLKALRHALNIVMGIRSYTLNNTSDGCDLVRRSFSILIGSSGSDSFFPGQLDEEGRGPEIFTNEEHRDRFYHAGFEINYILLSRAEKINDIFSKQKPIKQERANGQANSETNNTICSFDNHPLVFIKKSLPFTNKIPATEVNYIGDEWLYRYPEFLRGPLDSEESRIKKVCDVAAKSPQKFANFFRESPEKADLEDDIPGIKVENIPGNKVLHILDIRKRKRYFSNMQKKEEKSELQSKSGTEAICDVLKIPRTASNAKKRIISLPYTDPVAAIACCAFSPEQEGQELRRFFRLHGYYTKDVLDEASMVRNEWQTELHLSFYLLVENGNSTGAEAGLSRLDKISFSFFRHPQLHLRRASMSFRFDGDFFDRYWTCHFIEHIPRESGKKWDHTFDDKKINSGNEKQWSQRKVLELYFLHRILRKMNAESSIFHNKIRKMLAIGEGSLGFASLDVQGSMDDLQRFENILDLVEEDLMANLATLREKWDRREADRAGEKPRWTRNDEAKYRTAINKFCVKVERAVGKLQANYDSIRKLKEFLATTRKNRIEARDHEADNRDRKMADLDRQRAQRDSLRDADIRYLTYVTVIFQPLGFAASFYSMGGAPEPGLIISLVELSAAAFAVTLVLIWTYRVLASRGDEDDVLRTWSKKIGAKSITKLIKDTKQSSIQRLVHRIGLAVVKMANYILGVLHWCWVRIYKLDEEAEFPSFGWYGKSNAEKGEDANKDVENGHPHAT